MPKAPDYPVTPAVRVLRAAGVTYAPHLYDYVEHGGTRVAAVALDRDEHAVIKTLVLQTESKKPLIMLMHGDREVAVGLLARAIGAKSVAPCDPKTAEKITGYQLGGTSPFGLRTPGVPVYVERTILALPRITINAGKRGFLVEIDPHILVTVLGAQPVDAAAPRT
jgi:Cys-tRNA(Pro) deacylase